MSKALCSAQSVRSPSPVGFDDEYLAARSAARVLITSSTSQRVELVARRIHAASARTGRPFVLARARDLPPAAAPLRAACADLLDAAAGGSVLLGDVEEMPGTVQALVTDLLEELACERDPAAAVRLISGSTVSLLERVLAGTFSEQLFYRLNVIHVVAGEEAT